MPDESGGGMDEVGSGVDEVGGGTENGGGVEDGSDGGNGVDVTVLVQVLGESFEVDGAEAAGSGDQVSGEGGDGSGDLGSGHGGGEKCGKDDLKWKQKHNLILVSKSKKSFEIMN